MPGATERHNHLWLAGFGAGVGFVLAGAMLLWMLLKDWTRLIAR